MAPALDSICRHCGDPLPGWARPLGACGACLSDSARPVRGIPGPRYGPRHDADRPHPFDIVVGEEDA